MKAMVNQELVHMLDGDHVLAAGTIIDVEHFAYGKFYTITEPKELFGITIEKSHIEIIPDESTVYGNDCIYGRCEG